jgi:hypothetical protein
LDWLVWIVSSVAGVTDTGERMKDRNVASGVVYSFSTIGSRVANM